MNQEQSPHSPPHPGTRKSVFDAVRKLLGRGFRQTEVEAIDNALDGAFGPRGGFSPQDCVSSVSPTGRAREIGAEGTALIKRFEGCARLRKDGLVEAYPDPGTGGDPWTIGWGATGHDHFNQRPIGPDTVWTQDQCDARLDRDLKRYAAGVSRAIGEAPTSQTQFDALVSFHYNTGAIARATLTRLHVAGDYAGAQREFARWNRAGGRVLKGLVRRRAAEAALYGK